MSNKTKTEQAVEAFRKAGGILTMSEVLRLGIHRRQLYALRDSGKLEVISRGLYRLTEWEALLANQQDSGKQPIHLKSFRQLF